MNYQEAIKFVLHLNKLKDKYAKNPDDNQLLNVDDFEYIVMYLDDTECDNLDVTDLFEGFDTVEGLEDVITMYEDSENEHDIYDIEDCISIRNGINNLKQQYDKVLDIRDYVLFSGSLMTLYNYKLYPLSDFISYLHLIFKRSLYEHSENKSFRDIQYLIEIKDVECMLGMPDDKIKDIIELHKLS